MWSCCLTAPGCVLDTCYTGKSFAVLARRTQDDYYKPEDNVLFVHTGGVGGLFAQGEKDMRFLVDNEKQILYYCIAVVLDKHMMM